MKSLRASIAQRARDPRLYGRLQFGSALGLGVGLILSISLFAGFFGAAPAQLSDFIYQSHAASGQVVIVAIDDKSIQNVGKLPWQPEMMGALLYNIAQTHPRAIGLDLMLAEPMPNAQTIFQAIPQTSALIQPIIGFDPNGSTLVAGEFPNYDVGLEPASEFLTSNSRLGHDMILPDTDGVVRRVALAIQVNKHLYPALGVAALAEGQTDALSANIENGAAHFAGTRVPVDNQGRVRLSFFNFDSSQVVSAVDVLLGRIDLARLRDKIVLIGAATSSQNYKTPVSGNRLVSSTELQANLIETLLTHRTLVEQDGLTQVVMILLLAILAGATLPHFRILSEAGLIIIYFLLYLGYAFSNFDRGILVQPLSPLLALLLVWVGSTVYRYFSEERRRKFIITLLRRYVPPEEVAHLTTDFEYRPLPFGGVRRQVSVLALDLSDLEGLADCLTPPALIALLDQYVSLAVDVIFQHDGAIVKHTGSAILAAWNLWTDHGDHAQIAVRTAVAMKHELAEFNRKQPKELSIRSGIGVATGTIIAGRIGARHRAEYAIIGEVVGMAERIALKPERGVFIDVTTREWIGDEFDLVEVKPVRLRRKSDAANVWQLVEPSEPIGEIVNEPEKETASANVSPP